jgi:trimethylamine-N-oxide reductase (cytochrome c)
VRALLVAGLVLSASGLGCAGAPPAQAGPEQGERLYRSKCAGCHRAYPPSSLGRERWADVFSRMAPKARLSDADRALVLEYLQANARP